MSGSRNSDQENRKTGPVSEKRLLISLSVFAVLLMALLAHVFFIQKNKEEDYNKIVLTQRQSEYSSKTLPARRGDIFDRNGNRLATSEKVYILIVDPAQMIEAENRTKDGNRSRNVVETTIQALSEYFGADSGELRQLINGNEASSYIRFKKDVTYDEKQGFLDYQEKKNAEYATSEDPQIKKQKIYGVWFEDNYKRNYPYNTLACSVIGFADASGVNGVGGVEQYYNSMLSGANGREYGYLNDDADLEKVVKSAENGNSLILTIDASIQQAVEKYLKEWKEGEIGSKSAACVVMDPNNGEILAMASTNSFDLNDPSTTGDFTEEEIYQLGLTAAVSDYKSKNPGAETPSAEQIPELYTGEEIRKLGATAAMNLNWRNLCVSDTYEPGSTQKIFTVAGAMEEGVISRNDTYNCEGHVELSDGVNTWRINCVNRNGHGLLDVTGGITNSCNVVMMNIAFAEGAKNFVKYEKTFGFGEYTGIDLPAEADTSALGFSDDNIGRTQLATNSFGQNFNCTMIQMAAAYASVANGGHYYQPHVVKQIVSPDGALVKENDPVLVRETVSANTCDYLKEALFATVETGTGKAAAVEGYHIGGKTGTAQKLPRSAQTYVVSFCGFAPVEDPKLLCYVIVDEPLLPGEEAAHSSFASQIFSKVMAEALPAVNLYPEGTTASEYRAAEYQVEEAATEEYIQGENDGGELPDMMNGEER
ncbi:MAG: penicillin-binding protein 2 [Eubacteriales bacterium]|nr:penicillin-binding protein 2 [Eubacteriales bacterium]